MVTTIGSVTLPNISRISPTKESNLFSQPLPYSNSNETILMDLLGTTRNVAIKGRLVGDLTAIQNFIASIEAIQNGSQTGSVLTCDLYTSTKTILIQTFSVEYEEGSPNEITYDLTLQEGTVI